MFPRLIGHLHLVGMRHTRCKRRASAYTNLSTETVTVDRDALQLQLANGRLIGRSTGMTSTHPIYSIPPNGAHSIYVDFRDEDLEEEHSAALVWKSAVFAGSRELAIPYTPVTAR